MSILQKNMQIQNPQNGKSHNFYPIAQNLSQIQFIANENEGLSKELQYNVQYKKTKYVETLALEV
jgi:hypothetical protein